MSRPTPGPQAGPEGVGEVVAAGVDGTASGQAALAVAAALARRQGRRLLGIHVTPDAGMLLAFAPLMAAAAVQWREELERDAFLDTASAAALAGVEFAFAVERGDVSAAILRRARLADAALIVLGVGPHHRRWHSCPARRLAGSGVLPVLLAGSPARC